VGVTVRPVVEADRAWLAAAIVAAWATDTVASRGRLTEPVSTLPGFVAELDGERAGYAVFRADGDEVELSAIESLVEGRGVGRALLEAVQDEVVRRGLSRAWLITTNENLGAIGFYQRCGWDWVGFHRDEVGRDLKPEIPEVGPNGIEIRHELEFEWRPEGAPDA